MSVAAIPPRDSNGVTMLNMPTPPTPKRDGLFTVQQLQDGQWAVIANKLNWAIALQTMYSAQAQNPGVPFRVMEA